MATELLVPPAIDKVIRDLNFADTPFTEREVQQALINARDSLQSPSDADKMGAWAEILAFALVGITTHESPWGTFFGPRYSETDQDGNTIYFPDIAGADTRVIAHWSERAKSVGHPVLKARYADLAWDMCAVFGGTRRDPEMARLAIDAYVACIPVAVVSKLRDRFGAALRALTLALLIGDRERTDCSRAALLQLHCEVMTARKGPWWLAFDRLIDDRRARATEEERQQLIADLEALVLHFGDTSKPEYFNPHAVQCAAKRLTRHFRRLNLPGDVKRLNQAVARAFEHFAVLADPVVAPLVLQTAVNAYRDAGLSDESDRVRILMQEKIGQARDQMVEFETQVEIPPKDMDKFLEALIVDDLWATFAKIAAEFLPNRRHLEKACQKFLQETPLFAHMPRSIMADDHIAARVGSVQDDSWGRLIDQTTIHFGFSAIWLQAALHRAMETHGVTIEHVVTWANRWHLFDDLTFLMEGVRAWREGDFVKALHVLVPQVEQGLRSIVAKLGRPVTKPHPTVAGVSAAVTMGDILYSEEMKSALGPDFTLYFLALYADPRGMNLRNRVAHGLIKPDAVDGHLVRLLIHTLLVFGVWRELAEQRR